MVTVVLLIVLLILLIYKKDIEDLNKRIHVAEAQIKELIEQLRK